MGTVALVVGLAIGLSLYYVMSRPLPDPNETDPKGTDHDEQ